MGAVTTVGAFLDELRTQLVARSGLAGVNIYTGPVDHLSIGDEAVVFAVEGESAAYEYRTAPQHEVWESYEVEGRIWIVKAGGGEAAIKAARDRALALLEQVHDECSENDTMTATVDDVRVVGWKLEQFGIDGGRDCRIAFVLRVRARFTPA